MLETGLGGPLDSTNIVDAPLCSVITPVSYDHTAVLGDTIEKIAYEKSGIIKPAAPSSPHRRNITILCRLFAMCALKKAVSFAR